MKRILLVMCLALACGILLYFPIIYFKLQIGMSLPEIYKVKEQCEFLNYDHCNLIYYFVPDADIAHGKLDEPDKIKI